MQTRLASVNMRSPRAADKTGWLEGSRNSSSYSSKEFIVSGLAYLIPVREYFPWFQFAHQTLRLRIPCFRNACVTISTINLRLETVCSLYLRLRSRWARGGRPLILPWRADGVVYWLFAVRCGLSRLFGNRRRATSLGENSLATLGAYTRTEVLRATSSVA